MSMEAGWGGSSTFEPRGSGRHEHHCPVCQDSWAHNDTSCEAPGKPYEADSTYECPDHQPRSGSFFAAWWGESWAAFMDNYYDEPAEVCE